MNHVDITLYLNEYRVKALSDALREKTGETVEDKLLEAFDALYQQYVPAEDIAQLEASIELKEAAEREAAEAARRFAVYHVRENDEDYHFTSDYFKTPMQAAYRYRLYDRGELSAKPETLAAAFIETNPIDLKEFKEACDDIRSDKRITALIEFDLDEGRVSICDSGDNEWQTYSLHDFSVAAYKAYRSDYRSEDCRREIFNASLCGKEIDAHMIADKKAGTRIEGATMDREAFTAYLNSIRPDSDYAAKIWCQWAKELEGFDSSHGELPAGEYKTAEMFLNEFAERLRTIREIHGDKIAGQMISLAEISACPFPWEMKLAAEHLAGGGKVEDIPEMEEEGTLEDFDEYLPPQEDGMQMPPM